MNRAKIIRARTGAVIAAAFFACFFVLALGACKHSPAPSAGAQADAAAPFAVRDDSQGLLLTWIDEKGDFHVEQKVADVPIVGRDAVRAVDPARADGVDGDSVYVADLRVANLDGTYPVHTMTRADFDALAVTRREKSDKPTLAAVMAREAGAPPSQANEGTVVGRPSVIVYGASWCSACHQAMAYFKKKGITFIEKDIEKDAQAAEEMNGKLRRAGQRGGSIPVLDVRGRIMVGFDPQAVEEALGAPI